MQKIRTRFAPSPTGYLHIGGLRTALYSYLLAKKHQGVFVLRIEDTDTNRYVSDAEQAMMRALKRAGLQYDEGPDVGGPYKPYIQTQRLALYQKYALELIHTGGAYYCFCSKERLETLRQQAEGDHLPFHYDGHCKQLSEKETKEKLQQKLPYVIRQKIPAEGTTNFKDAVYGTITVHNRELDEGVLIKSDGIPTYNFANVIDDHTMEITHVLRGCEFLSSTPKFILLYKAFGWQPPVFAHLPVIIKDGGKKLSKREKDAAFEELLDQGFLPEAIINYVALLGWNPKTEQEIFTLKELEEQFDLKGLNKAAAIFDKNKLLWVNSQHIQRLSLDEFHTHLAPYYEKIFQKTKLNVKKISELLHTRTKVFTEVPEQITFFEALPAYDTELFVNKKMKTDTLLALTALTRVFEAFEELTDWQEDTLRSTALKLIASMQLKNGQVLWPLRAALSGRQFTPGGAIEIAVILGKQESLARIAKAVEKLQKIR
ncbi:MAG: glutamate--tRNA ligase [Candidatus Kerfeldbacteria bacterium RIFCSPHIGHO2_02_FULL_42_14]|uniref:Glutamate--tRNA ligase n=1 Tax=Candidatus Kerfeldbacteria bacterium RIFCSPHIGHO2_02_FULL_42_14 TaxID=1798540 RepID=A0A1G2ARN3_9BACT|nr:MAG: glutamate--tRNA ligase [Candidatus Kerfeldbacteria bacterium RIFCSPHIGHO2_02_FULL_42_14]OGY80366.1 MAG: glutamate--tRNA ligase [Candidatus Kerfeldbacteria bacterium RIFCSPHIGHO2_12_FULL_42_13]OGY83795.1 MAG: glutamate--tRNA ligase [Candidatus Kerfeldbacteria bacterium RIFCSPLOWO2_02_FULL_42_19]OGY87138.1 MAG: glutamate--tRNA ligase [Candidatus Kerfeldbacteria bacterium RIFCSPLOWO2_12_FULL_43_9]